MTFLRLVPDYVETNHAEPERPAPTPKKTAPSRQKRRVKALLNRTPARLRWLQDVHAGVVTASECIVSGPDMPAQTIVYPSHPSGTVATHWLCESEVRALWEPSEGGHRRYRVLKLNGAGRELLASWDGEQ